MKAAVLDLGTNTFHLYIAEKQIDGSIIDIHKERRFVRLGKGGISKGEIAPDAYQRALATLSNYAQIIGEHGVETVRAMATSALRSARNGAEFISEVKEKTGLELQIIDGDLEASYIFEGVCSDVEMGSQVALVMDIGGGSVEFIIGQNSQILWKRSFEIGAQRLFDMFYPSDPIPAQSVVELEKYAAETLQPLFEAINEWKPQFFIGSSGTFETLWDMAKPANGGNIILQPQFAQIHQALLRLEQAERLQMPGMIPERVDMIVVASCLVDILFNKLAPLTELYVSKAALKEGIMASLMSSAH